MKVTTLRLPESMYEALEAEAEEREKSLSEHVRDILRQRSNTQEHTQQHTPEKTQANTSLAELEQRVSALEAELGKSPASAETGDGKTDLQPSNPYPSRSENTLPESPEPSELAQAAVSWLRDRDEPANKSAILDAVYPGQEAVGIKSGSLWERHIRPVLEEESATYTRNRGWELN